MIAATCWVVLIVAMVETRLRWQASPGLWQAIEFWVVSLLWAALFIAPNRSIGAMIMLLGLASNAIATISNGGHMPVIGLDEARGIWVPFTEASRAPWLCDVLPLWTSIGDWLILGGALRLAHDRLSAWSSASEATEARA